MLNTIGIIFLIWLIRFFFAWMLVSGSKKQRYLADPSLEEFELEEQAQYLKEYNAKKKKKKKP